MWDIKDKVALITGATNGIGKATAIGLAREGARLVIHGRDKIKTNDTAKEIIELTGNKNIDTLLGDLSVLSEVKTMAEDFKSKYKNLHVLINNAGAVYLEKAQTKTGFEMTFAVNYLSHFLLTQLLLDTLKKSAPARIIHVSSEGHRFISGLDLNKLLSPDGYRGFWAYAASKICVILFSNELAKRLKPDQITSNSLHPGVVSTGFASNTSNRFIKALMPVYNRFLISPEKGAETSVYLASASEYVSGKYFSKKRPVTPAPITDNPDLQKKLWDLSMDLVKEYL